MQDIVSSSSILVQMTFYNLIALFFYFWFRRGMQRSYTNEQLIGCLIGIGGVLAAGTIVFFIVGNWLIFVLYFVVFILMVIDLFNITR
ncbi:MAG: hypothetical protein ACW98Y_07910 [Candidatus Thorarchaeota archaeon]